VTAERRIHGLRRRRDLEGEPYHSLPSPAIRPIEPEYGVERNDDGSVTILLGTVAPFSLPRDTAIRFALLILRKCGVSINISGSGING
jgi:hypothetical protein